MERAAMSLTTADLW